MRISKLLILLIPVLMVPASLSTAEEIVVKDGDATLSRDELAYRVERWTPQMRAVAIEDEGDRLELINLAMANKKMAAAAEDYVAERPELRMEYKSAMLAFKREFLLRNYSKNLEIPDFTELAKERFTVNTDKWALIPERRISSHILFASPPGAPRDELTIKAQKVLDELRAGADFYAMVDQYSEEPGASQKKGKFNRWIKFGEQGVTPRYSQYLFEIENIGEYSELVNTEFGIHIIRLDGIQEASYKTFDEVKGNIIKELEDEYRDLAMKDFVSQFQMSEDAIIDNEALEAILAPYAPQE